MYKIKFLFQIVLEKSTDFADNIVEDVKQHPHRKLIKTLELMIMFLVIDMTSFCNATQLIHLQRKSVINARFMSI